MHVQLPAAATTAAEAADAKLGRDTVVLGMAELFGVVDAFVITSAQNTRHVRTLVEEIERGVKEPHGSLPSASRGCRTPPGCSWTTATSSSTSSCRRPATTTTSSTCGRVRRAWRGGADVEDAG